MVAKVVEGSEQMRIGGSAPQGHPGTQAPSMCSPSRLLSSPHGHSVCHQQG